MLIRLDSFDHYANAKIQQKKWDIYTAGTLGDITIVDSLGRGGTQALRLNAPTGGGGIGCCGTLSMVPTTPVPSGHVVIPGFWINVAQGLTSIDVGTDPDDGGAACLFTVRGSSVNLFWVRLQTNGKFTIYRGTTPLGTTSVGISQGVASFFELKVTLGDGITGSADIELDGENVLHLSGIDTTNGGTTWDEFRWGNLGITGAGGVQTCLIYIDDFHLLDGSGGVDDDFWGNAPITAYRMNANGARSQWTPLASTNVSQIDEVLADGDTSYNSSATLNAVDAFASENVVTAAPIKGAQLVVEARTASGSASVKLGYAIGGTDYLGDALTLSSSYAFKCAPVSRNPATGAVWASAVLNAAEKLYKKTA